jgi:hypothetical protein
MDVLYSLELLLKCLLSHSCRLGMIEKARRHLTQARHLHDSDPADWEKLQDVEMHLGRSTDARKIGDWKSSLREADAAIAAGADSSQLVKPSSLACVFSLSSVGGKWK